MKLILKLAWRNIWRNKRRSIITILAIMFATLLTEYMRSMQIGTYDFNIKTVLEMFTGYLQIQKKNFRDEPTLRNTFLYNHELKKIIKETHKIKGFAPRIIADGLIGNKSNSYGAAIIGIDPELESKISNLFDKINVGKKITNNNINEILVGYKLLENLNASIGDELVILTTGFDGTIGNHKFKVSGTINFGNDDFDAMAVFMNIDAAKNLLSLGERISTIAISLFSINDISFVKKELQKKLLLYSEQHSSIETKPFIREEASTLAQYDTRKNTDSDSDIKVLDWSEILPEFKQSIDLDNISGMIYLIFLIVIVAFGILNTIVMSITERFREFGIILALGARQLNLVLVVFFEVIFLSLIGLVLGNVLGISLNYYFYLNPILFSGEFAQMYEQYGWAPALYFSMAPGLYINTSLIIFTISVLVYIFPAWKLYRLEPLKGIRYT